MIAELADLLDNFPGEANQTKCFTHILNLVARSIIRQFDIAKAQANEMLDDATKELAALAVDLDIKEQISQEGQLGEGDGNNDGDANDDNVNEWSDVHVELSDEEREALDKSLQPVHLVLVKVSYQIT